MKLFLGSIVFTVVACFSPLAFGQNQTSWFNSNTGNLDSNGSWDDPTVWSNGVPSGAANTGSTANVFFSGTIPQNTNTNPTISIAVPAGQSAQALFLEGIGVDTTFPQLGPGIINLNIANGATLNITGNNIGTPGVSLLVFGGVTANINGGGFVLPSNSIIGVDEEFNDGLVPVLNFNNTTVTVGDNVQMFAGLEAGLSGSITQNNSTVTVGDNFELTVGESGASASAYTLANGSTLTTGANATITVSSGNFTQDSTSTLNLGDASALAIGVVAGDNGTYNQAGNVTLNNSTIVLGEASGATGAYNQTGGATTGTGGLIVGEGGQGIYTLSGGSADFEQGIAIGVLGGTGTLVQSGNTTLTSGASNTVSIGVVGGTGLYILSSGTANFQGGMQIGTGGTVTQSGNSTLNVGGTSNSEVDGAYNLSGGTANFQGGILVTNGAVVSQSGGALVAGGTAASEIDGTYTISAGTATFNNGLNLVNTLNLNGGTVQVQEDLLSNGGGSINLHGGTLKLVNGADTTFNYNFTSDALQGTSTIDVSASNINTFTFANTLASTTGGGISLIGNGTTTFNFATGNTYNGVTSIQSGTLNTTQDGIVNSSNLNIGTGGVLNLTLNSGGFAFAGAGGVSGTGVLNVIYNTTGDALVLTNANNFSGSIVLGAGATPTQGVLQIYNGTYTDITDNGTGSSVTIGGTPLVSGGASAPSSGTVILSGANTYTGQTTISQNFTVQAANFNGDVINNGTLSTLGTQASPGSLHINNGGNLVSTGVITVFTNGAAADAYTASGATLSGVISTKGSGTNQYAVVTTTQGITIGGNGNLNDAGGLTTNAATALFSTSLSLDPTDSILFVNTTQNLLSGFATTPNQRAVALVLDPLTQAPPPAFIPLLNTFNTLSAAQIPAALEQLTPESLQYSRMIAFENATFMVQKVNGILGDMRAGYTGLDTNGISYSMPGFNSSLAHSLSGMLASNAPNFHTTAPNGVNYYPDNGGNAQAPSSDYDEPVTPRSRMTPAQAASPTSYDGQVLSDSPIPMRTSEPPTLRTSRFTEFVAGDVVLADLNQNANMPAKASYTAGDVSAGVGFRMTSNLTVGLLFDYNHTNAKTDGNGSKTTVNSYSPGLFATYYNHDFYINGLFSFGLNQYSNSRNVPVAGETANSDPNGQQYVANLDFGYDFHPAKQWVVGPTLGVTYTHLNVDSFSENGAPEADLNIDSQDVDSLRSRLGGHVEYMAEVGNIILQPHFTAMWQHEYLDNGPGITSNFQAYGTSPFTIQTASPSKDTALLGLGLTATLNNSLCFYLDYMADVGGGDYLAQSIVGGVKASF